MLGHYLTVLGQGEPFAAQAVDIDGTGRLVVERQNGRRQALSSGEVRIRLPSLGFGPPVDMP